MKGQKPWPAFSREQDFAERRGLEPKVKISELGEALDKLVQLNRITNGDLRTKPQPLGEFLNFLERIAILMPLNHFLHAFRVI